MEDKEFKENIFKHSDKEIVKWLTSYRTLSETESAKAEMSRRMIKAIRDFNESSSKQSKRIFWLTLIMGIVALLQLIILLKQF